MQGEALQKEHNRAKQGHEYPNHMGVVWIYFGWFTCEQRGHRPGMDSGNPVFHKLPIFAIEV
jgi:hypothetical protein